MNLERIQTRGLVVGIAALAVAAAGAFVSTEQFFRSYLLGYLFWLAIALGSLPVLALHHLVGGAWGFSIRRILEAGTRTLPLMGLLILPVLAGIHQLYEWSHAEVVAADPMLQHKSLYLNVPFFIARAAIYFGAWLIFAHYLNKWSAEQDETGDPALIRRFQLLSAPGILVYALTITFASLDWGMSLEPHWFSTIYGMLFIVGQGLATFAFAIVLLALISTMRPVSDVVDAQVFHDLGNLVLAFVMLWAYMSFSQYLIIWSGNLPEPIAWYLRRGGNGWQWVAAFLAFFHFAIPFVLLLGRRNKRSKQVIAGIAAVILGMRLVDLHWLIMPAFYETVRIHWMDIVLPIGIGGIWIAFFVSQLRRRTLLPMRDPHFVVERAT